MRVSVNWRTGQAGALRSATFDAQARNKFSTRRRCGTTRIAFFAFVAGSRAKQFLRRGGLVRDHKTNRKRAAPQFKSRFIEMFGDPLEGNLWQRVLLSDLCTKLGSGATPKGGKAAYKPEGVPLVRSMNVFNGRFEFKNLAYIDDSQAARLKNVTLVKGDVLLNITGASVARCCVLPDNLVGGRVNQHVAIIRPDRQKMLPIILNSLLISNSYQTFLLSNSKKAGATREAITKDDLKRMTVPLPPLALQQEFADFVSQVDKLRFGAC